MDKPIIILQGPVATMSGYGVMSRAIGRNIIELDRYDVKVVSLRWGETPMTALGEDNPYDFEIIKRITGVPMQLPRQPELLMQISVPNEFQNLAKYNIGYTAMIETTAISHEWVEGLNRMDVNLALSMHGKRVAEGTVVEKKNQMGQLIGTMKVEKPVEVLPTPVDTDVFKKISYEQIPSTVKAKLDDIPEQFCFLFVGHWLKGGIGEDRKNVGLLVKLFCDTFKNKSPNMRPALILKTSGASFSLLDREDILNKVAQIRASIENAPNVYVLHGHLTDVEMNGVYNHPKVKCHISFTKGEGQGIPLLEACMSVKPIIASGWSGHLDFLNVTDAILVGGELRNIEGGAVWPGVIIPESQWFNIDHQMATKAMYNVWKNPSMFFDGAYRLAKKNRAEFSYEAIKKKTADFLDAYVPRFAAPVPLQLPPLKLPTLQKIEPADGASE
jgi:hypothetical protein